MRKEKTNKIAILGDAHLHPNMKAVLGNMVEMVGDEFELDLITGDDECPYYINKKTNVFLVDPPSSDIANFRYSFSATEKYLTCHTPDLLMNISKLFPLGIATVIQGERHGIRTLLRVTEHFLNAASTAEGYLDYLKKYLIHNIISSEIYSRADTIVPIGPNLAEDLVDAGFPADKITVQYQPFDPRRFTEVSKSKKKNIKSELGLDSEKMTVLFVGRIIWGKGADRLVKIIEGVLSRSSNYEFCILGGGPLRDHLDKFGSDVHCPGVLPHRQIHKYFQSADLLIHPSRNEGAVPNVILEALATGTPVIASAVGEIDTVVSRTTSDPEKYIKYILNKEWEKDQLPEGLSWDVQSENYTNLFLKAIDG